MSGLLSGIFGSGSGSATSSSSRNGSYGSQAGGPAFSFAKLQQLYERLSRFRESDLEKSGGGDAVVETVRQITEALVWGEQNDAHFFDFFCEKNILADFVRVLGLPKTPKKVKLQLLQTLQMLVQNIRRTTSVYYLLSNNHVNRLITTPLDLNDEEVLAYYITLMKSLAMRLDNETIQFFFIQRHEDITFPLYIEATKLFSHRDQMVRATVRNITLQVYRVEDEAMQRFVLRHAAKSYFSQLALHLRDLWLRLDVAVAGAEKDLSTVQEENELQQDLQIYLSDVFELAVDALNEVLADRLLNCAMLPVLLTGIAGDCGGAEIPSSDAQRAMAPSVALCLVRQVLDTFHSPVLLEPLVSALLMPWIPEALAYVLPPCGDAVRPLSSAELVPPDCVENPLRSHFLGFLTSSVESTLLLSSSVVHGCILNKASLPRHLLEDAGVLRPEVSGTKQPEVLALLLQALQSHGSWQPDTLRVYSRILLDIFLEPRLRCEWKASWAALRSCAEACLLASAQRLGTLLKESLTSGNVDDGFLDVFLEEWESHKVPLPDVKQFCGNPQCVFLPGASAASSQRGGGLTKVAPQHAEARKLVSSVLMLRRVLADLALHGPSAPQAVAQQCLPQVPWGGAREEPSPALLDDGGKASLFREGTPFDMCSLKRITCSVESPDGKSTRYLLLHDNWLLLVQPDLAAPGWGVPKTVRPIWQVQTLVDRSEPRTLQLGLQGGEAAGGGFSTMSLNFEDVTCAHEANAHLQQQRQALRAELMRKIIDFVDSCSAGAPLETDDSRASGEGHFACCGPGD